MLVACRLAGLSALETHYAGVNGRAQCGDDTISPSRREGPLTPATRATMPTAPRPARRRSDSPRPVGRKLATF
jgi:hypothetical protein